MTTNEHKNAYFDHTDYFNHLYVSSKKRKPTRQRPDKLIETLKTPLDLYVLH